MLLLKRKRGESIILSHPKLPGDICIVVSGIQPESVSRVCLGVKAPRSIMIARSELLPWTPEQGGIPQIFTQADRQRAYNDAGQLAQAYIRKLENAVKAADDYEDALSGLPHTPRQYQLQEKLIQAMREVDYLEDVREHKAAS